ncbi:hypothetical protein MJM43_28350, partial [Salmonella enterica subsp. enterica serovar Montevideo]|nr:hypothetical protein [Salmonella enterica subsp. enterica serovar Montevideo]
SPDMPSHGLLSTLEQHLQRIIGHLNTMHTISSMAWRQRPHHGTLTPTSAPIMSDLISIIRNITMPF